VGGEETGKREFNGEKSLKAQSEEGEIEVCRKHH